MIFFTVSFSRFAPSRGGGGANRGYVFSSRWEANDTHRWHDEPWILSDGPTTTTTIFWAHLAGAPFFISRVPPDDIRISFRSRSDLVLDADHALDFFSYLVLQACISRFVVFQWRISVFSGIFLNLWFAKPMVWVRVAFHENDGNHENDENDEDNSDSYKQGVECWIHGNHGNHENDENHENPGCKPRVPQTTGLEIPDSTQWNTEKPQRCFIWCVIKCRFGVASDAKRFLQKLWLWLCLGRPWLIFTQPTIRKTLVSVKFLSAILGPEMAAPILWTPGKKRSFCRKNHVHKIPCFRGGGVFWVFFLGGGGESRFYFYGREDFSETKWFEGRHVCHLCDASLCTLLPQTNVACTPPCPPGSTLRIFLCHF